MSAALAIQAKQIASKAQQTQLGQGAILTNPRGLRRFRAALGDASFAPVHIGCYGDSITDGVGVEDSSSIISNEMSDAYGWPGRLRGLFAQRFGALGGGIITPNFDGTDSRVTLTGSPSADFTTGPMLKGKRLTSAQSIQFTTPACTAFDILHYAGGSADGSLIGGFSYQIDGGTITTGLAAGVNGSPGHRLLSFTGLANQVHTVKLVGLHATNLQQITGLRYHNNQGVTVGRLSKAGWTLFDAYGIGDAARNNTAIGNSAAAARLAAIFGAWGQHLSIIAYGQNDAGAQLTVNGAGQYLDPATYEAYLRAAAATITAYGGCTLLLNTALPPAGGATVPTGGQPLLAYHAAARRVARDTDHVAHLSFADRWGTSGQASAAEVVTLGMLAASTSVHPSRRGHGDMANALFQTLLRQDLITG